jgi:hypothetical protein
MEQGLYEYELEEILDELIASLIEDNDDFRILLRSMRATPPSCIITSNTSVQNE